MKKILNITEHKDGTYTLNHLTHEQMNAIQSALIQNWIELKHLKERMQREGRDLNDVAAYYLTFADEASDQMSDLGF